MLCVEGSPEKLFQKNLINHTEWIFRNDFLHVVLWFSTSTFKIFLCCCFNNIKYILLTFYFTWYDLMLPHCQILNANCLNFKNLPWIIISSRNPSFCNTSWSFCVLCIYCEEENHFLYWEEPLSLCSLICKDENFSFFPFLLSPIHHHSRDSVFTNFSYFQYLLVWQIFN